nr:hypothetical protein Iba_chr15dCG6610 [Ipomoea batatas]
MCSASSSVEDTYKAVGCSRISQPCREARIVTDRPIQLLAYIDATALDGHPNGMRMAEESGQSEVTDHAAGKVAAAAGGLIYDCELEEVIKIQRADLCPTENPSQLKGRSRKRRLLGNLSTMFWSFEHCPRDPTVGSSGLLYHAIGGQSECLKLPTTPVDHLSLVAREDNYILRHEGRELASDSPGKRWNDRDSTEILLYWLELAEIRLDNHGIPQVGA